MIAAARQYGTDRAKLAADVLERWDRQVNADSRGAVLFLNWATLFMGGTAWFAGGIRRAVRSFGTSHNTPVD